MQCNGLSLLCVAAVVAAVTPECLCAAGTANLQSVVKIYATIQSPNYAQPWQGGRPEGGTGSGFIIAGRRILTNGHVVSDARFLQVQKDNDPRRYEAHVNPLLIGHDCDLATLTVDDPVFFEGTRPLSFAKELPQLNDEVTVVGYPMGGERVSITKGIVSRMDYGVYSHSGIDQHLVMQVDAAINPGNSGGPVFFRDRVVGLAFQGLIGGESIGYAIPLPVIEHYLTDIKDGVYNGYPELGAAFMDAENPALRRDLRIPEKEGGVIVVYVDPFGAAKGLLKEKDVLLSVERSPIASDGTIAADGSRVLFHELMERKQWGQSVSFDVWRDGSRTTINVPLTNPPDPFVYRREYDCKPRYMVVAGLVFTPLSRGYLSMTRPDGASPNGHRLHYLSRFAKVDGLHEKRDEFVVLTRRLPHPANTYADPFLDGVLSEVNGMPIRRLEDIRKAFASPKDGFHTMRFLDMDEVLVLDAATVQDVDRVVRRSYAIPQLQRLDPEQ
jgi:S1-C subfamily serine protease